MIKTLVLTALSLAGAQAATIAVTVERNATAVEKLAASELVHYLGMLYPRDRFVRDGKADFSITLATAASLRTPESFAVTPGAIRGADARGVLFGVYALLEKLGCGFYLSSETVAPRSEPFSFAAWNLEDAPLVNDRFVFNWHNFLSSASGWEVEDWQRYIAAAARMRFNGVMVHAYGNNPMFQFRFNGELKPVGYLATTRSGRDWGTQHVNDVRRLIGGEVFTSPVFGSSAAQAPDSERAAAATKLMQQALVYARSRGLRVTFALDVDTESANPQNLIRTLPESARLHRGGFDLPNPDTPEGYGYFKTQIAALLETYPQIDRLAIWFRNNRTPWLDLKPEELPAAWRAQLPAGAGAETAGLFAVGRIIAAAQRVLRDLKRADIEVATGTWRLQQSAAASPYLPEGVTYLPLDWTTEFGTAPAQRDLLTMARRQRTVPVVWAHHDDRTYIGRPYTPFAQFSKQLADAGSQGFGIIHWTTRPLDLYFKSLAVQVWKSTRDQNLEETCRRMAADQFGAAGAAAGAEYLLRFVREAPQFGRETSNRFIDHPLDAPAAAMDAMRARLGLLDRIDARALSADQRDRLEYFRGYERFMLAFFTSHAAWERAADLFKQGDLAGARREIGASRPEEAIRAYTAAARHGGMTRGEQALIVSLNLRWRPYIVSLRQALGLEPVRVRFGPTQHEPLAQGAGSNTFAIDADGTLWKVMGEKETAGAAEVALTAIMGDKLQPGRYRVSLRQQCVRGGGA